MSRGLTLVFGIAFIIMALVSLFGIVGSLFEISTAVRVFSNMLWGFVIIDNCIQNLQKQPDSNAISESLQIDTEICTHNETILVVRNVIVALLLILFSVLFARVSSSYARKLEKKFKRITPAPSLSTLTVASISTTDFNPHA
ncbi:6662_t:CDS:2 [Cetraspora pellucida]|uniref:6662_t:CDS:1 n=1 Tax=Cetraspora pellucida TaxID=1433469 RepID=A0A9N8ZVU6_9GLOM|nr:6662_t:CDS:2 [Cetraspora pellucida]